jgi:ribosomal protein S18 acetylase RimI-like enzyme
MGWALRPATIEDVPLLREALYHALYVPEGASPLPRDVLDAPEIGRYVAAWGRNGDVGVIAEVGDEKRFAGAAWLRVWTGAIQGYGFIDEAIPELSIAVLPGHRNRGLGSAMLRDLLARADAGCPAVSLSVSASNPARRLYERLGFRIVSDDGDAILMRRDRPRR